MFSSYVLFNNQLLYTAPVLFLQAVFQWVLMTQCFSESPGNAYIFHKSRLIVPFYLWFWNTAPGFLVPGNQFFALLEPSSNLMSQKHEHHLLKLPQSLVNIGQKV